MKTGGESSATCQSCAALSSRHMPKPRNLGRLRYSFLGAPEMKNRLAGGLILKLSVLLFAPLFLSYSVWGVTVEAFQNSAPARRIDFNRDIRPILADKCWGCHGPDATAKKIKLR